VLAHELAHVRQRHGMRLLVQATLLGAATSMALGDFSSLLAAAPALIGQLGYSREFERDADDETIALLRANDVSPLVMVALFEAIARPRLPGSAASGGASSPREAGTPTRSTEFGIAFSTHPADDERIARFRAAAAR